MCALTFNKITEYYQIRTSNSAKYATEYCNFGKCDIKNLFNAAK